MCRAKPSGRTTGRATRRSEWKPAPRSPRSSVERELGELLDQEIFEPPEEFREKALISDESVHEEAARDPQAWWAEQAKDLEWFEDFTEVLDDSEAPFYRWFADGKLNASHNALDRHVDAGQGDRVAYHWRGRRARSAT